MDPVEFRETLRKSVESASRDMLSLSRKMLKEDPESKDYFHYEAHYKAHLYHFLLLNGINYEGMFLETRPETSKVSSNHIDLWYRDPKDGYNFLIEVKQIYGLNKTKDDINDRDYLTYYTDEKGSKSGIVKDIIKLGDSCGNSNEYHGVMLMYWADPKVLENLDLQSVKKSVIRRVREEKPETDTTQVELLWSSSRTTEYVSLS